MQTLVACLECGNEFESRKKGQQYCGYACSGRANARKGKVTAPVDRFWSKVDKSGECWEWTAGLSTVGYGKFGVGRNETVVAHRYSYELEFGKIEDGLLVCHRCDNRKCVRPSHLFLGTHLDNTTDALNKGRLAFGERQGTAKLTEEKVAEIILLKGKMFQRDVAKLFGISQTQVSRIQARKHWRHAQAV
jgi:hypothetical protein